MFDTLNQNFGSILGDIKISIEKIETHLKNLMTVISNRLPETHCLKQLKTWFKKIFFSKSLPKQIVLLNVLFTYISRLEVYYKVLLSVLPHSSHQI